LLEDYGQRVQYSVFECRLDEQTLGELVHKLKPFAAENEDSIRVYRICQACLKKVIYSENRFPMCHCDPEQSEGEAISLFITPSLLRGLAPRNDNLFS